MKTTATAAAAALALGGFSLAMIQPATATGSTAPETATTGISQEVGAFLYTKLDEEKPAAWENSGLQRLVITEEGTDWITTEVIVREILKKDPKIDLCAEGWGIQQDKLDIDTASGFTWPETIEYPNGFEEGATLTDNKHEDLDPSQVPGCETTPTPTPTPTPTEPPTTPPADPTPTPEPTPPADPTPSPTPDPTPDPSPSPTPDPKPTPDPDPSPKATPEPSPTPDPEPSPTPSQTAPAVVVPQPTPPAPAAPVTPVQPTAPVTPRQLPETGANPAMAALAGAGLLVAGLGTVALVRNRRRADSANA